MGHVIHGIMPPSEAFHTRLCTYFRSLLVPFLYSSAAVVFIWGALCLKLSYQHFSHIMTAKRINVLVLCSSVLVEIIQPDFNIYRVR